MDEENDLKLRALGRMGQEGFQKTQERMPFFDPFSSKKVTSDSILCVLVISAVLTMTRWPSNDYQWVSDYAVVAQQSARGRAILQTEF
jgi:hypothetical protein